MARKKLSEFKAKTLLFEILDLPYTGVSYREGEDLASTLELLDPAKVYVVKVDEGIKGRFKKGLVKLNIKVEDIPLTIDEFKAKGFSRFLIEEYLDHTSDEEKYIALERIREGNRFYFSSKGGINIEENQDNVKKIVVPAFFSDDPLKKEVPASVRMISKEVSLSEDVVNRMREGFDKYYFSFMEINPLVIRGEMFYILDLAVEVDSTGEFFVEGVWNQNDFVEVRNTTKSKEEENIEQLAAKSQASISYTTLNPNGSIFMLLSGGGASIVLADEAYNRLFGNEVANYGEYSGNPTEEETYIYTKNVISLLFKSQAHKKVLIIGGGVANFTDVRITFRGIIKALQEDVEKLKKQQVKVFVRRGGPNQEEGLKMMSEFLETEGLYGFVGGPDIVLTDIVNKALVYIKE